MIVHAVYLHRLDNRVLLICLIAWSRWCTSVDAIPSCKSARKWNFKFQNVDVNNKCQVTHFLFLVIFRSVCPFTKIMAIVTSTIVPQPSKGMYTIGINVIPSIPILTRNDLQSHGCHYLKILQKYRLVYTNFQVLPQTNRMTNLTWVSVAFINLVVGMDG